LLWRGLLAIVVGVVSVAWPNITVGALVILFAVYAFIAAGTDEITALLEMQFTPAGGSPWTPFQGTVTIKKDVIDFSSLVPTPTAQYLTQTQGDARYGRLGAANEWAAAQQFDSTVEFQGVVTFDVEADFQTAVFNDNVQFASSVNFNVVSKTANYALTDSDFTVKCTSGTFTLTLPSAIARRGRPYVLKNSGTGVITVNTTSAQTIDGQASGAITLAQYDSLTVQSDNANWMVI